MARRKGGLKSAQNDSRQVTLAVLTVRDGLEALGVGLRSPLQQARAPTRRDGSDSAVLSVVRVLLSFLGRAATPPKKTKEKRKEKRKEQGTRIARTRGLHSKLALPSSTPPAPVPAPLAPRRAAPCRGLV